MLFSYQTFYLLSIVWIYSLLWLFKTNMSNVPIIFLWKAEKVAILHTVYKPWVYVTSPPCSNWTLTILHWYRQICRGQIFQQEGLIPVFMTVYQPKKQTALHLFSWWPPTSTSSTFSTQLRALRWPPAGERVMKNEKNDKKPCWYVCVCVTGRTYGFAWMHECVPVCAEAFNRYCRHSVRI